MEETEDQGRDDDRDPAAAMSSTDLNSTPRNTSSSKTDDFIAIAAAGIMKDMGLNPSIVNMPKAINSSTQPV